MVSVLIRLLLFGLIRVFAIAWFWVCFALVWFGICGFWLFVIWIGLIGVIDGFNLAVVVAYLIGWVGYVVL